MYFPEKESNPWIYILFMIPNSIQLVLNSYLKITPLSKKFNYLYLAN